VIDDYRRLPSTDLEHRVPAPQAGFVSLEAEAVGRAAVVLGAGRARMEDRVNPAVGIEVIAPHGSAVRAGDTVFIVRHDGSERWPAALRILDQGLSILPAVPSARPLVLERVVNG
jgi:thymidine phosphorylase